MNLDFKAGLRHLWKTQQATVVTEQEVFSHPKHNNIEVPQIIGNNKRSVSVTVCPLRRSLRTLYALSPAAGTKVVSDSFCQPDAEKLSVFSLKCWAETSATGAADSPGSVTATKGLTHEKAFSSSSPTVCFHQICPSVSPIC